MPLDLRFTIVAVAVFSTACARPAPTNDPGAVQYNDYYSEQGGGQTSTPGQTDQGTTGPRKQAKAMKGTGTRGAKPPKRIRAKKPVVQGDKPTNVPDQGGAADIQITGVLPTTTSVGSHIEVLGTKLDTQGLVVRIDGKEQKIVQQEANRVIVQVVGQGGGPIEVGTKAGAKKQFKASDESEVALEVLKNDGGFGKPRKEVGHGLIGNVYSIGKPVEELPAFDSLGAPVGTIAVDELDIPSKEFKQTIGGNTEWFGIHFRGSLNVVDAGDYEFCLAAGDGALLFLDGTDVIDNDGAHETKEECSAFYVEAGEYQLDLLWYQGETGELGLRFTWAKDGGQKVVVPASALFPPEDAYSLAKP